MNDSDFFFASTGLSFLIDLLQLLMIVGMYVFSAIALMAMFRKTNSAPWKAWVPVVREWELFRLAGLTPWWAIVLFGGGLLLFIIGMVLMVFLIFGTMAAAESGSVAGAVGMGVGGIFLFILLCLAWYAATIIINVRMMNRINRGFALSLWFTVLGIAFAPVWFAILGWGSARWIGAPDMTLKTKLSVNSGTGIPLAVRQVVIGASDQQEQLPDGTQLITITDPSGSVSPFHTQLNWQDGRWVVTDLQSTAGTWYQNTAGTLSQVTAPIADARMLMVGNVRVDLLS